MLLHFLKQIYIRNESFWENIFWKYKLNVIVSWNVQTYHCIIPNLKTHAEHSQHFVMNGVYSKTLGTHLLQCTDNHWLPQLTQCTKLQINNGYFGVRLCKAEICNRWLNFYNCWKTGVSIPMQNTHHTAVYISICVIEYN